jgi:hypothetical protein
VAGIAIGSLVCFGLLLLLALFCFRRRLRQQSKGGPAENYTEKSGGEGKVWNKFGTRRREDVWGSRDRELEEDGYGDLGTRGREDYEEGEEGRFLNPQPRSTAGAFLYKLASPTFPTLATFITKSLSPRIPSPSHLSPAHFPAEERSLLSSVPSFHDDDEDSIDVPPRSNQAGWIAAAGATGRLATMARKRSKQPLSSDRDDEAIAVEGLIGRRERKKSDRMVGRVKGSREMLEEGTWMKGKEGEEGSSPDDVVWRGSRGGPSPKLDDLYGASEWTLSILRKRTDVGDSTEMDGTAEYDSDSCRLYRIPISSDSPPSSGRIVVIARDVPTIDPARDIPSQLWTLGR